MKTKKIIFTTLFLLSACSESYDIQTAPNVDPIVNSSVLSANIPTTNTSNQNTCTCQTSTTPSVVPLVVTGKTKKKPKVTPTSTPTPTVVSPSPTSSLSVEDFTQKLYDKAVQRLKGLQSFKTDIRNYTKGNYLKKQYVEPAKSGSSVTRVAFQRPRKMLAQITEAPLTPSLIDTKIFSDGGDNVKIKVPGILGLLTFTFPYDKPDLTGYRGYTIKDVDIVTLETRLDNKNAKLKILGTTKIAEEEAYVVEVTNIKTLDDKITRELLSIRKSDYLVVNDEMYVGEEMVFQNKYENFQDNVILTESDFKI